MVPGGKLRRLTASFLAHVQRTEAKPVLVVISGVKAAFHDTDILARILARMSMSVSWNAALSNHKIRSPLKGCKIMVIGQLPRAIELDESQSLMESNIYRQSCYVNG